MPLLKKKGNLNYRMEEYIIWLVNDNKKGLAHSYIVMIFQLWEDVFRNKFVNALGLKERNDLKSDVFGDLRTYRQCIIHADGKANKKCTKNKVLKPFQEGEIINFTEDEIEDITEKIEKEIISLSK